MEEKKSLRTEAVKERTEPHWRYGLVWREMVWSTMV
ncbi:hypothetical protein OIU79_003958 [Salix purpurea]|uniref:Uncharacterized protein n=1 Tax=Salix purpurea TaxID=77065 RepID=A0A9Q0U920_SALPP|nr:hypothetical protein OIU79_003958 [Salix purpurea]